MIKEPRIVYAVPRGWDLGLCVDDGRIYFIKPHISGLAKIKPEAWAKIKKKYGELIIADRVYDPKTNTLFLPPKRDDLTLPRFRKIIEQVGEFSVCRGGELV